MTSDWADYLISEVQYDSDNKCIVKVKECTEAGGRVTSSQITARQVVVSRMKSGVTYMTITPHSKEGWNKGASLQLVEIDGTDFIKTVDDGVKRDNLGDLPRFES